MGVEYNRYLQEVVQLLESDPSFREKLEKADPEDIRVRIYYLSILFFHNQNFIVEWKSSQGAG